MIVFQKIPNLIPIDLDNVASNDWIILLEANTIVDSSGELRVARTTQERKIVWRFRSFRRRPFLVIDGYDPRIHTLYLPTIVQTRWHAGLCLWKERDRQVVG